MMKDLKYFILALMMVTLLVACHDDDDFAGQDVEFCVRAAWQNGLGDGVSTRALTATILADGTADIVIDHEYYPATINVICSDGTDFILEKSVGICAEHNDYWQYTPSVIYKDRKIIRDELEFEATAVVDATNTNPELGDVVEGRFDYRNLHEGHILLTLHHTKALVRFAFKVSAQYDKIRYIKVTKIVLNGKECTLVDKVLTQSGQFIAYAYVDPEVVTTSSENTIQCTYNIYDKDDTTTDHITRADVVAKNSFKLNGLSEINPGYYYDLNVTLNPDYLYVLSEHDNKHITIE